MSGLSTMAGLTWNYHVFAEFLLIDNIGMAGLADLVTGVGNGAGGGFRDGVTPVMAVLAEGARDDRSAQQDERDQRYRHDNSETDEVLYVFEQKLTLGARQRARSVLRRKSAMFIDIGNSRGER